MNYAMKVNQNSKNKRQPGRSDGVAHENLINLLNVLTFSLSPLMLPCKYGSQML